MPLLLWLLFVMIPAYSVRHPAPADVPSTDAYSMQGPASAPASTVKPAPEMSKDFFRVLRDLQNSMEDFSHVHDRLVNLIGPVTNFSDERLSSSVFLVVFLSSAFLFLVSRLVPRKLVFLAIGWTAVALTHPALQELIKTVDREPIRRRLSRAGTAFKAWSLEDVVVESVPENREVEIFELQKRSDEAWEAWIFAVSPYTPRSPLRVSGDRPRGTRFFEDVQPPEGWEWSSKKWMLDLLSRDWVEERMLTAVEIESQGERWVYDIGSNDIAYPVKDFTEGGKLVDPDGKDWEEGSGLDAKGEWRRRRWIRRVQRKTANGEPSSDN